MCLKNLVNTNPAFYEVEAYKTSMKDLVVNKPYFLAQMTSPRNSFFWYAWLQHLFPATCHEKQFQMYQIPIPVAPQGQHF